MQELTDTLENIKKDMFETIRLNLGGDMVDVELDPTHYESAFKRALQVYRQRSSNAVEESYVFIDLLENTNDYILPDEIIDVRQIFRRSLGNLGSNTASNFEPMEAGFMNMYLLQSGRIGGLVNYELFKGYQELAARMFGGFINFKYNRANRRLTIFRNPRANGETVMLWAYNYKPDYSLLKDQYSYPWLLDYTEALCKKALGEAREKFATIAGPGGGTVLNGGALKAEANADIERLIEDLRNHVDGSMPMSFIFG